MLHYTSKDILICLLKVIFFSFSGRRTDPYRTIDSTLHTLLKRFTFSSCPLPYTFPSYTLLNPIRPFLLGIMSVFDLTYYSESTCQCDPKSYEQGFNVNGGFDVVGKEFPRL